MIGDVVHEQVSVGREVMRGPEAAVLLLSGGVGEVQRVLTAVDGAGHAVRVLHRRVILVRPFTTDQAEGDGGFTCFCLSVNARSIDRDVRGGDLV